MATEQDCIDAIGRIDGRIAAVKDSPQQAAHYSELVRQKAGWIGTLNKLRSAPEGAINAWMAAYRATHGKEHACPTYSAGWVTIPGHGKVRVKQLMEMTKRIEETA